MPRFKLLLPSLTQSGNFDEAKYFYRQLERLLMCFNVRSVLEWFRNGCKKIKIPRIVRPISESQLKSAIDKALADSAAAPARANEISNGINQAKIRELQTHLDAANHAIDRTANDYAARMQELQKQLDTVNLTINSYKNQVEDLEKSSARANEISNVISEAKIRELQNHLDAANHTIDRTAKNYAARMQELQKQLDTANITINSYKNQVEYLEKISGTVKTATIFFMALKHQREISQVCLEKTPFRAQDVLLPLTKS